MQIAAPSFSSTSSAAFGFPPSGGAVVEIMLSLRRSDHCRILSSKRWASDGRTTTLSPLRSSRTSVTWPRRRAELSLVASVADSGHNSPTSEPAVSALASATDSGQTSPTSTPAVSAVSSAAYSGKTSPTSAPAVSTVSGDKAIVPDTEFSLAKVSFGVIGLAVGGTLLSYGFGAYFSVLPGSEWSAIMLTYGFPLGIIGMALKYAELKPVPCITYSDAEALREKCSTPILKQVRSDVTRYRYGDEQHLDEALKRIFQYGQGGGIPRRSAPRLQSIREEVTDDGKYSLVLVFEAKALKLSDFEQRQAKFASFFGPGITSEIGEGENDLYEVRLISETT